MKKIVNVQIENTYLRTSEVTRMLSDFQRSYENLIKQLEDLISSPIRGENDVHALVQKSQDPEVQNIRKQILRKIKDNLRNALQAISYNDVYPIFGLTSNRAVYNVLEAGENAAELNIVDLVFFKHYFGIRFDELLDGTEEVFKNSKIEDKPSRGYDSILAKEISALIESSVEPENTRDIIRNINKLIRKSEFSQVHEFLNLTNTLVKSDWVFGDLVEMLDGLKRSRSIEIRDLVRVLSNTEPKRKLKTPKH